MMPEQTLALARQILTNRETLPIPQRARATAVVIRYALEMNMAAILRVRTPGAELAQHRVQLICLGDVLPERDLALRVRVAWGALSEALHHNGYDLPPAEPDLFGWMSVVDEFIQATRTHL